jgi:DNA-binding phage protein
MWNMSNDPLGTVLKAQQGLEDARREFMAALVEAVEAGVAQTLISQATGISRVTLWRWLRTQDKTRE